MQKVVGYFVEIQTNSNRDSDFWEIEEPKNWKIKFDGKKKNE